MCDVTTYESVKSAAESGSVWYFEGADVAFVRYELQMETYKIYVDSWHGWAKRLGFYAWEVIEGVVSVLCVLICQHGVEHIYRMLKERKYILNNHTSYLSALGF